MQHTSLLSTTAAPVDRSEGLSLAIARILLFAPLFIMVAASAVLSDAVERSRVVMLGTQAAVVSLAAFLLLQAGMNCILQWRRRRERRLFGDRR